MAGFIAQCILNVQVYLPDRYGLNMTACNERMQPEHPIGFLYSILLFSNLYYFYVK